MPLTLASKHNLQQEEQQEQQQLQQQQEELEQQNVICLCKPLIVKINVCIIVHTIISELN